MNRAAAALARQRWAKRDTEKTCPFCGAVFRGDRSQIYCRPSHQNAAAARRFRERHRGEAPLALPTPSKLDASLERAHALAEAEWARREGDLAEARRWEQRARQLAAGVD